MRLKDTEVDLEGKKDEAAGIPANPTEVIKEGHTSEEKVPTEKFAEVEETTAATTESTEDHTTKTESNNLGNTEEITNLDTILTNAESTEEDHSSQATEEKEVTEERADTGETTETIDV